MKKTNAVKRTSTRGALLAIMGMGTVLATSTASAAIDLTGATTAFGELNTALSTIGGLVISAALVAVTFKWIKGMIFS